MGSYLSLLTAVCFFSISVWSSGDAVVGALVRIFGGRPPELSFALAYAVFAAAVLVVSVYGFRLMLLVNKIAVVAASLLFLVGFAAFVPSFDSHFPGRDWYGALRRFGQRSSAPHSSCWPIRSLLVHFSATGRAICRAIPLAADAGFAGGTAAQSGAIHLWV